MVYEAWEIVGYENKASLQNLITLITCIENIFLQKNIKLSTYQASINDSQISSQKRRFGHMKDDILYMNSE